MRRALGRFQLVGGDQDAFGAVAVGALAIERDGLADGRSLLVSTVLDPVVGFAEQNLVHRKPLFAIMHTRHLTGVPPRSVTDGHEVSLHLPASVDSARAARRAVDKLRFDQHAEAIFNLRLLITELVGNSVRHAGLSSADTIILEIQIRSDQIRAQVTDRGPGFTRPVFDQPPFGTGGRGLYLVDALADRWGAEPTPEHDGWLVWFELDLR